MIVASKERYLPVVVNTLVLSKDDWYFYLHRDVYDQAVILTDRYDRAVGDLMELIGNKQRNEEAVRWFYEQAPKPLHILAPYLQLIDGEIARDIELICGVLHVVTAMIQVRQFVLKPPEIRKSVSFSLTIKEEYEMAWERFFVSALPYEQRGLLLQAGPRPAAQPELAIPVSMTDTVPLFPVQSDRFDPLSGQAPVRTGSTDDERTATRNLLSR